MNICVIGSGYVGLVTGACFAHFGHTVVCVDSDEARIARLQRGDNPLHEPGLSNLLSEGLLSKRLAFAHSANLASAMSDCQVVFIAVGTPAMSNGSADLQYVLSAAQSIGDNLCGQVVVVNKSTVPIGTAKRVYDTIAERLTLRGIQCSFDVVSNPEFLKEGSAVEDFLNPDRIIVGTQTAFSRSVMRGLYEKLQDRIIYMDTSSAELTKYAANSMLALRISFMNEIALLAEKVGADVDMVRLGVGTDKRVGRHFLQAGCGYGGSCFPKDVSALVRTFEQYDIEPMLLQATTRVNRRQKRVLLDKIVARFGASLRGLTFAVWGLAFKPGTDDVRESPALELIEALLLRGAGIRAYDPEAMGNAQRALPTFRDLTFVSDMFEATDGCRAIIICTEWFDFASVDFSSARIQSEKILFDGRNMFKPETMYAQGWEYHSIGRPPKN